jgi:hypothetical protein
MRPMTFCFRKLTVATVTDALLDAHSRGVNVYVVHSGHDDGTEGKRLAAALGDRYTKCRGTMIDAFINNFTMIWSRGVAQ